MTAEQNAIASLLGSFLDLLNGYPVQELHEPPKLTVDRALKALPAEVRGEFEIPEELL